jgi:hypothetical protein
VHVGGEDVLRNIIRGKVILYGLRAHVWFWFWVWVLALVRVYKGNVRNRVMHRTEGGARLDPDLNLGFNPNTTARNGCKIVRRMIGPQRVRISWSRDEKHNLKCQCDWMLEKAPREGVTVTYRNRTVTSLRGQKSRLSITIDEPLAGPGLVSSTESHQWRDFHINLPTLAWQSAGVAAYIRMEHNRSHKKTSIQC